MAAPRPTERPRPTLLLLAAAAFTLLTLHIRGAAPLDAFQQGLRDILEPLRSVTHPATETLQTAWNRIISKVGVRFDLNLPHVALSRAIGEFSEINADPDGQLMSDAEWQSRKDQFLPTDQDRAFLGSIMAPVTVAGPVSYTHLRAHET